MKLRALNLNPVGPWPGRGQRRYRNAVNKKKTVTTVAETYIAISSGSHAIFQPGLSGSCRCSQPISGGLLQLLVGPRRSLL